MVPIHANRISSKFSKIYHLKKNFVNKKLVHIRIDLFNELKNKYHPVNIFFIKLKNDIIIKMFIKRLIKTKDRFCLNIIIKKLPILI